MTTIINTHDMNSVLGIGENIIFICKGRVGWRGNSAQVMSSTNEDLNDLVQAILTALKTMPEDDDNVDETRTWWPFKDFGDLERRVDDVGFGEKVPEDLKEYIRWPGESAASSSGKSDKDKKGASEDVEKFSMTITGESLGMKYVVRARCVVEENKVKYIEWSENESTK